MPAAEVHTGHCCTKPRGQVAPGPGWPALRTRPSPQRWHRDRSNDAFAQGWPGCVSRAQAPRTGRGVAACLAQASSLKEKKKKEVFFFVLAFGGRPAV